MGEIGELRIWNSSCFFNSRSFLFFKIKKRRFGKKRERKVRLE